MRQLAVSKNEISPIEMGKVFYESGMFPDHKSAAQCATKLIVGQSMGLTPYDSMTLHIIQNKVVIGANVMSAAIKASGKYDYHSETTDQESVITFFQLGPNGRQQIGVKTYTIDMARRAGLANSPVWKKFPEAMLFARCISAGYREHCPDALATMAPVYVESHGESEIAPPPSNADMVVEQDPNKQIDDVDQAEMLRTILTLIAARDDGADIALAAIKSAKNKGFTEVDCLEDLNYEQTEKLYKWLQLELPLPKNMEDNDG